MTSHEPQDAPQRLLREAAALSAVLFALYAWGACRTIFVGDSGELVAAAATLGIAHPTSYPLYVLLGKLWITLVPLGSVAMRMSLLSAVCAALSCGVLYSVARRLPLPRIAALTTALLVAWGPSFWSQANIQRVYALNALLLAVTLWLAFEWSRQPERSGWLTAACFTATLGASNHTFMGLVAVCLGLWAVARYPVLLRRPKQLAICCLAGLAGLLPYAYLPIRSRMNPRLDWGNPETLDSFLTVVLRRNFWDRAWWESPADLWIVLADYLRGLGEETLWIGAMLALIGLVVSLAGERQRRWPVGLLLLAMLTNLWSMAAHGSRSDIFIWHRYYIPSYIAMALLAGYGVAWIARRWGARRATVALLIPAALLLSGWRDFDRSRFRLAEDFSRKLLDSLPPGATLSASDDNILFVLIYLHLVEGLRPDVRLLMQGVGDARLPNLRFDPDREPLYFTHHPNWQVAGLEIVPTGMAFRTASSAAAVPLPLVPTRELDGESDPRVPKDYLTGNLIGHFHYMLGTTHEYLDHRQGGSEHRHWPDAQAEFVRAANAAAENDVLFYNLGLIYSRNGLPQRSLAAFERAAEINPRHIASNSPVRPVNKVVEAQLLVDHQREILARLNADPELSGSIRGSAAFHRRLAKLLEGAGESLLANGQWRLAAEAAAESTAGD